jgi:hypothetical protein
MMMPDDDDDDDDAVKDNESEQREEEPTTRLGRNQDTTAPASDKEAGGSVLRSLCRLSSRLSQLLALSGQVNAVQGAGAGEQERKGPYSRLS